MGRLALRAWSWHRVLCIAVSFCFVAQVTLVQGRPLLHPAAELTLQAGSLADVSLQLEDLTAVPHDVLVKGSVVLTQNVQWAVNDMTFEPGAVIYLQRNNLTLHMKGEFKPKREGDLLFASFPDQKPKALPAPTAAGATGAPGQDGMDSGDLFVYLGEWQHLRFRIALLGQDGGDGQDGARGVDGQLGRDGTATATGLFGCSNHGQDGTDGSPGGPGGDGGRAGRAGNGGRLIVQDVDSTAYRHFTNVVTISTQRASPGNPGRGGVGGAGGLGGSPGRGSGFCTAPRGGRNGADGRTGNAGLPRPVSEKSREPTIEKN